MAKRSIPALYPIKEQFKKVRESLREAEGTLGKDNGQARAAINEAMGHLEGALELEHQRSTAMERRAAEADEERQARIVALEKRLAALKE